MLPDFRYTRGKGTTQEKKEKDEAKRAKQAEAARLRYHRLSAEEKRALNIKRTMAQKRKRQREKELEELENLLRQTNDIQEVVKLFLFVFGKSNSNFIILYFRIRILMSSCVRNECEHVGLKQLVRVINVCHQKNAVPIITVDE